MPRQYKSDALAAAHETAQGLADAGDMAKRTMKAFDEMCLTPATRHGRARPGQPRVVRAVGTRNVDARNKSGHDDV